MTLTSTQALPGRVPHDLRHLTGRFAVIGDIHGCLYTLEAILHRLGGTLSELPDDLTLVSVGDIHDKGAHSDQVLLWAMEMVKRGKLIVVDSNHGAALVRRIRNPKKAKPSVEATYRQLAAHADGEVLTAEVARFLETRPPFVRLSGGPTGEIVVAHAGVAERLLEAKRFSPAEWRFTTLARDFMWSGTQTVVVGHIRTPEPLRIPSVKGSVIRIDTGCGESGGALSAYLSDTDSFITVPLDPRDVA